MKIPRHQAPSTFFRILLAAACVAALLPPIPGALGLGFAWNLQVVDEGVTVYGATAIALDSQGRPHIAYADSGRGLVRYARLEPSGWQVEDVPPDGQAFGMVSLVLDGMDRPHVTYYDADSGLVKYAHRSEAGWQTLAVDKGYFEGYSSLSLDRDGNPHVAYPWANGYLRHAKWAAGSWAVETVDAGVVIARYPSLAFNSLGRPQIAYYGNGELRRAAWIGYRWSIETVDRRASPEFVTLALSQTDAPRIGYRDGVERSLRYVWWNGSGWVREVVDAGGDTGWDAKLTLDGQDGPHLAYYDRSLGRLKYARLNETVWETYVVDVHYIAGWYCSLAVGTDGRPHFAYYSWSERAIRYALGGPGIGIRSWPARQVTHRSASLVAELTSLGNASTVVVSIDWRLAGAEWTRSDGDRLTTPGFITLSLTGLTPETTLEYRAVATADGEEFYGDTANFTTTAPPRPSSDTAAFVLVLTGTAAAVAGAVFLVHWRRRRDVAIEEPTKEASAPGLEGSADDESLKKGQ